jgi:Holliday junction resolvasome RuvABC endonuclease subunit
MATILALDLSYTGTGIAVWRDGRVSATTVRTARPQHDHNGWEWPRRQRHIVAAVLAVLARATQPVLCVKEQRIQSLDVAGASALDLAGLHAVVEYVLAAKAVPVAHVNLTHIKAYATGKGNASKDAMLAAARLELSRLLVVANDNEADALYLLAMAVERYGHGDRATRLCLSTPLRRAVLAKVAWPHFARPAELAATPTVSRREIEEARA